MKKTKLTRTLLAACSIVALSAVMYGCTGDGAENDLKATEGDLERVTAERDAALAAQAEAEAQRDAALAAQAAAEAAQAAAEAAKATADAERDAANAAAAAAAQAQMNAEAAQATAEAAQAAAETAQANAEAAQAAAEMAQADAEAAQGVAEAAQAAAEAAQGVAEAAQAAAEAAQGMAEEERDAANAAAAAAAAAQATAEMERDDANAAAAAAAAAQATAEGARDAALAAQATAEGERDDANAALATANADLATANADLAAAIMRAETAETALAQANSDLEEARARIAALEGGTAPDVLDPIKQAASDAATAAGDAATAADAAADAAEMADDNRATIQTGDADSVADAMAARAASDTAAAEAMKASDASTMAQAATNADDARPQRDAAQAAQMAAEQARMDAEAAQGEAEADAMAELKIDGTMKSVGDVTVDANAPNNVITTGTGATLKTIDTGLQEDLNPSHTAAAFGGQAFVAATTTPVAAAIPYRQAHAARTFDIGKVVDSADDMARLMIVTSYVGSKTVKVYGYAEANPLSSISTAGRVSTTPGKIITALGNDTAIGGTGDDADTTANLRSLGMYYLAGGDGDTDLAVGNAVAFGTDGTSEPTATTVYSYVSTPDDPTTPDVDETALTYLVLDSQRTEGATTVYVYRSVDIMVDASRADGPDDDTTADAGEVTATIPEATDYDHIHFGVWAGISGDGANMIADHGIGFVQSIGDGMTADGDMPNFGSATYNGHWAATVQAADPDGNGAITLTSGVSALTADFDDDEVMVDLMGLAMLEGDISGGMFSGDKATVADDNTNNLTGGEDFTGSFSGAFFGATASEAGGVFDFGSDDNEAGAFRGSFGGAR